MKANQNDSSIVQILKRASVTALVATMITACGGGGGGGQADSHPPVRPVDPAPSSFSISGSIAAAASTAVDSDVNDQAASYRSNDSAFEAQAVSQPISIGGYANAPGTGADGRSFAPGDVADFYEVELDAGQAITMTVAEPNNGDLDLYLWSNGVIHFASTNLGSLETVYAPFSGTFQVEVAVYTGASNYVLNIGDTQTRSCVPGNLSFAEEFVAGEAVLKRTANSGFDIGRAGLSQKSGMPTRESRVGIDRASVANLLAKAAPAVIHHERVAAFSSDSDRQKWETLMAIKALRLEPGVEYAEPNYRAETYATPNDEHFPIQWHYDAINLPAAWDYTTGSYGTVVAVVDTGVLLGHPDLQGQLVPGYDFISDSDVSGDGDGIDPNPDDPGDNPGNSSFHGTHVAGTVGAATNNSAGVAGVNWNVGIMPVRVLGMYGGTFYDIRQGVRYAAGLPNDSGLVPDRRADVINLSLGGPACSLADQDVYRQARQEGSIIVAAAGNAASNVPSYPAAYDDVISVSATNSLNAASSYSNYGSYIDVAAPGGDVNDANGDGLVDGVASTDGDDLVGPVRFNYELKMGTSMAAPHVSGVLALMKSVNPTLNPDAVDSLLARGDIVRDLGAAGWDEQFGYGLIDARLAVEAALHGSGNDGDPRVVTIPGSVAVDAGSPFRRLVVRNAAGGNLTVNRIAADAAWLSIIEETVDGAGLGSYTIAINRNELAPGQHSATIEIQSSAGPLNVPVTVTVDANSVSSDAGPQHIVLLNASSNTIVDRQTVSAYGGFYVYRFDAVASGSYLVRAGSDFDNDGTICDGGESCGEHARFDVTGNVSSVDFFSGFDNGGRPSTGSQPY